MAEFATPGRDPGGVLHLMPNRCDMHSKYVALMAPVLSLQYDVGSSTQSVSLVGLNRSMPHGLSVHIPWWETVDPITRFSSGRAKLSVQNKPAAPPDITRDLNSGADRNGPTNRISGRVKTRAARNQMH
jgi:hypothetical protein